MTLPTTKNIPGQNPLNKKFLIHGERKIGKTTLVSKLFPDAAVFATDPTGFEELPVYKVDVKDWMDFRRSCGELATYLDAHPPGSDDCLYDAISVDTADELSRWCSEHVLKDLSGGPVTGFKHISDWEWGKGYDAVYEEFRLRIGKLCKLGLPVVFISHSKEKTKKTRTGLEITVHTTDIGKGKLAGWLEGFVDYVFFAEVIETKDGPEHVLHTAPSESYLAGARMPEDRILPEPLPLDGERLRAALLATSAPGANREPWTNSPEEDAALAQLNEQATEGVSGIVEPKTNGKTKKAEPKKVQDARKVINAISSEKVAKGEYTPREEAAMNTVSEYQAKQREAASA